MADAIPFLSAYITQKILPLRELTHRIMSARTHGLTTALCNGCFDCYGLTLGHLATLEFARERADIVVAAVNSDASVRRLKGAGRPVMTLLDRIHMLSCVHFVHFVIEQEEDNPIELVKTLLPSYIVKGGDTLSKNAIGPKLGQESLAKWNCQLLFAPRVKGLHSTEIIGERNSG